jgi:hypothetical protein
MRVPVRALVLVAIVAPGDAHAQAAGADPFSLEWNAPAGCPDGPAVSASVRELLRARPTAEPRSPLHARASVVHDAGAWTLRVSTAEDDAARERVVSGADCGELADAAAVIVALAVDPSLHDRPAPPVSLPASRPPGPAALAADAPAPPPASPPTTPDARVAVSGAVLGALDAAALPAPAPGLGVEVGVAFGRLGLAAQGAWFPSQRANVEGSTGGGEVSLLLAGALVRYRLIRAPLELDLSLAFEAGSMHAEAVDVALPSDGRALWLAPGAGLRAGWPITPNLAAQLGATVLVPVSRERFVVTGLGDVHGPPAVTVRGTLGIEARIW